MNQRKVAVLARDLLNPLRHTGVDTMASQPSDKPTTGYGTKASPSQTPFHGGNVMLVLSRKRGETIYIGDRIKITVIRAHGNHIRIGVDAPDEIRIVRGELDQWSELVATDLQPAAASVDRHPLPC